MGVQVTKVEQHGDDRLVVTGTIDGVVDDEGRPRVFQVQGWVSAMEHHYRPSAYDEEGRLREGVEAGAMTDDERAAYWASLLEQARPALHPPEPEVLFERKG